MQVFIPFSLETGEITDPFSDKIISCICARWLCLWAWSMWVCVCETDGVPVCERHDAWMNVCKNTGFLRAFFFLRQDNKCLLGTLFHCVMLCVNKEYSCRRRSCCEGCCCQGFELGIVNSLQVFKVLESFDKQILSGLCFSIGCFFTARFWHK